MYQLRGHHLFCLLGYRGMGYSKEYVENMTKLHQTLRKHPETRIQLIEGPDQLCEKYPDNSEYHCEDQKIYRRDAMILEKLGFNIREIYTWAEIEETIRKHVVPTDIVHICSSCSWRSYGVCEEGVQNLLDGKGLTEVK